jgi:cobalt-precorrin 5A hydrolase
MNGRRFAMGVGLRRGAAAAQIVALARSMADRHEVGARRLQLFTLDSKAEERGLQEAARELGATLHFLSLEQLASSDDNVMTTSPRVVARFGLGSICEAAALAGAGPGAQLVAPRSTNAYVACALAVADEEKTESDS